MNLDLRCTLLFSCFFTGVVFMKPLVKLVKTGNMDFESVMVLWAIQRVISSLHPVSNRPFPLLGVVCIHKLG
jgi:hypothetical protein